MNVQSVVVLVIIAVAFAAAIKNMRKNKCYCKNCADCERCGKNKI